MGSRDAAKSGPVLQRGLAQLAPGCTARDGDVLGSCRSATASSEQHARLVRANRNTGPPPIPGEDKQRR